MTVYVLVVVESAAFGRLAKQALEMIPGVEVAALCRNGQAALDRLRAEAPDLVILDAELPGMNGIAVLQAVRREGIRTGVIMMSAAAVHAREMAAQALELGALDFVEKCGPEGAEEDVRALRDRLAPLAAAAARQKEVRAILQGGSVRKPENGAASVAPDPLRGRARRAAYPECVIPRPNRAKPAMVLIGVSTGGPEALTRVIPALPGNLRVPVLIVQHMPPMFTQNLAQKLDSCSALRVKEAVGGEVASQGNVYIAPGGKHLKVMAGAQRDIVLRITGDPPENNCRPAVDVLFRSAAEAFPGLSVAVILTGMGHDGTAGLRMLRTAGTLSIAQDEASCTVFGMPKEAIEAGLVDVVAPLNSIASEIVKAVS